MDTIYFLMGFVGLVAGTISGVIGTGSTILLLPLLVYKFGPQHAVPMMGIAAVMANIGKVAAWRHEVDWRAMCAYSLPGIIAAAVGARTLLVIPPHLADVVLGIFFVCLVPIRHWLVAHSVSLTLKHLAIIGAVIGFLTGVVVSTGPLSVAAFTMFGLAKGSFIATEAASSLAIFISKVATFGVLGVIDGRMLIEGIAIGASLMVGSFIGKSIVLRMKPETFRLLLDSILIVSGVGMMVAAIR